MMVIRSVCIQCALRHITHTQSVHYPPSAFSLRPSCICICNLYLYSFLFLFQLYLYLRKITPTQSVHYPSFFWFCAIAIALCAGIFCCEHLCALAIALCVFAIALCALCIMCSGMFYCEHLDTLLTHWTAAATY